MNVREATTDDVATVQRVADRSWHAAHDDIVGPDAVDEFLADHYDAVGLRERAENSRTVFLVADDGEVVGFVQGVPREEDATYSLAAIYVLPGRWGEGIGTRLIERFEAVVRERGGERIRLVVMADNDAAVGFYESRGYERVGDNYDDRLDVEGYVYATEL